MSGDHTRESSGEPAGEYWAEASRPLASLAFVVPLLAIYEWGVMSVSQHPQQTHVHQTLRNGVDYWLRAQLSWLGFGYDWCVPMLLVATLVGLQILSRQRWSVRFSVLWGMAAEAAVFAALLIIVGQMLPWTSANIPPGDGTVEFLRPGELLHSQEGLLLAEAAAGNISGKIATPSADAWPHPAPRLHWVTCLGAGIYEEFVFRLCLVPLIYGAVRLLGLPREMSLLVTVTTSGLLFAAAHYLQVDVETNRLSLVGTFDYIARHKEVWSAFGFRFLAGCLFGSLLMIRGFGIAAGCHMIYDLFVGFWMV